MSTISEFATLTSKGQITLPKSIRQLLGVDAGGKIVFELGNDGRITVSRVEAEHEDPAIAAFLSLLTQDIQAGIHIRELPEGLLHSMLEHVGHVADLNEDIDGEVAL